MVKLGEYSASPQIVTSTVEAISNGIRNQLSDSLPIESATSADNDFEDELFKDWWDEANKARLFRLSQHIYEESESSGRLINCFQSVTNIFLLSQGEISPTLMKETSPRHLCPTSPTCSLACMSFFKSMHFIPMCSLPDC